MGLRQGTDETGPVFIVGTGRCGSTIVDSVLSMHPAFSWMPSWVDSFRLPEIAVVNRLWAIPGTDAYRLRRFFPTPVEPYETFKRCDPTFLTEEPSDEVYASAKSTIAPLISRICRAHGNPRYLAKLVGRPVKIELFARLFPDAHFVHVTRELKPTLSSLLKVDFYTDWGGDLATWPWEEIPAAYLEFYDRCGRSNVIGAAIGLYLNRHAVDAQLSAIDPERVVYAAYAHFVEDPIAVTRHIASRIQLDFPDRFADRIRARQIHAGADEKWKSHFSREVVAQLNELETIVAAETSRGSTG